MATINIESQVGTPTTPDPGFVKVYSSGTTIKYMTSDGTVRTVSLGITTEDVQDLLQTSFNDNADISWTYDDANDYFEATLNPATLAPFIAHLTNTNNPHAVSKTQVGLSNVPNIDASQRANHAGTQLASTISDLSGYLEDYLDRNYDQNPNQSINTTTTMADRLNINFTPKNTANYVFTLNLAHSHNANTSNTEIELLLDGVIVDNLIYEPKDSGGSDGSSGTDQRQKSTLSFVSPVTQGVSMNVQCRYRTDTLGVESTIKNHVLKYERYI